MPVIYRPPNVIDAHLIADRLRQAGLDYRIEGEFLQGGIGELQAMGLVGIWVADHQVDQALVLISEWEAEVYPQ